MSQSEQITQGYSRWWEFYAVRYAMGSVIGGVIFFFLCKTNPALKPILFGAENGRLDGTLIVLFAAFGLTYCYLASAPMLVFHAGRFLLDSPEKRSVSCRRLAITLLPPALLSVAFYFTGHWIISSELWNIGRIFFTFVLALASLVIWLQCLAVILTLRRSKQLLRFYQKLATKRTSSTNGIVESYRHLREHGNSFAIVVLEIVLAILLFTVGNFAPILAEKNILSTTTLQPLDYAIYYVAVLLIWTLPAACVWLISTYFEREFSGV